MVLIYKNLETTLWDAIHIICISYRDSTDTKYINALILSIFYLLPYSYSRYAKFYICNQGIDCSPDKLLRWSVDLRNFMNRRVSHNDHRFYTVEMIREKFSPDILYKNVWGNILWRLIHYMAALSEIRSKYKEFKTFMVCLQHTLPCRECMVNLKKHLTMYPIDMYRGRTFEWSVIIHNATNRITHGSPYSGVIFPLKDAYRLFFLPLSDISD